MSTYTLMYKPLVKTPTTRQRSLSKSTQPNTHTCDWSASIPSTPISTLSMTNSTTRTRSRSGSSSNNSTSFYIASEPLINVQDCSPFFQLPAELRNQIYQELLCPKTSSLKDLSNRRDDLSVRCYNQTSTNTHLYPAILRTCRRIASEAQALLYTSWTFHAHPSLLTSLPHLTSPSRPVLYSKLTKQIRRWQISLRLDTDPRFSHEDVTKAFSGAEYLEIRVWQAQFEACDFAVLKLFAGVRGVGLARVGGSVNVDLARWLEDVMMQPEDKDERDGPKTCCCIGQIDSAAWLGRQEMVCGRCYRKLGAADWKENEWDVGPPGI